MSDKKGGEKATPPSPPPKTEIAQNRRGRDSQAQTVRRDEGKSYLPTTPLPGKPVPKPLPDKPVKK